MPSSKTIVGTASYIDPRVARADDYDELCDVFSFGVILFECLCRDVSPMLNVSLSLRFFIIFLIDTRFHDVTTHTNTVHRCGSQSFGQ